jgi:hypothetical protein
MTDTKKKSAQATKNTKAAPAEPVKQVESPAVEAEPAKQAEKPAVASAKDCTMVTVTNISKGLRRIPSTGVILSPGETREVLYDNWVKFTAEAGHFKIH